MWNYLFIAEWINYPLSSDNELPKSLNNHKLKSRMCVISPVVKQSFLSFSFLFIVQALCAQVTNASLDSTKIDILTENKWAEKYAKTLGGIFYIKSTGNVKHLLSKVEFISYNESTGIGKVKGRISDIRKELLSHPEVTFIQKSERIAKVESLIRTHDLAHNKINYVHNILPNLRGQELAVSVKEGAYDTLDLDIASRSKLDAFSSALVFSHATDMATLIAGAGNSSASGTGVARGAQLFSDDFLILLPNSDNYFQTRNISVQNHSYGVEIENFYGIESVAFDEQAQTMPSLLHVFSAGNLGTSVSTATYDGIEGFANLTGSFKQAKNVLLVTATDENGDVPEVNSSGPNYDGRIKPELTAFGAEGTSEAAALTSGSVLLLQERYQEKESIMPKSDMIKSFLIAGSDDIRDPGPDFKSGYGQLNLFHSLQIIDSGWYSSGSLSQDETTSFQISVNQNLDHLNVVLTWRDPPAEAGASKALINDLDVKVSKDLTEWLPWVLDSSPNISALSSLATTGPDRLNNVEMVTLYNVFPGEYSVEISGFDVAGTQEYSVAYFGQPKDSFLFTYPTSSDPVLANDEVTVRWENGFETTSVLEIDYLNDNWIVIGSNIPESQNSISFQSPDSYSQAVLRMTVGGQMFTSDTFSISPLPELELALNCENERVLTWENIDPSVQYELSGFNNGALKPLITTTDTFAILDISTISHEYFSVRTSLNNVKGVRDATLNVNTQNVACYLNRFLLTLIDEVVKLNLELNLPQSIDNVLITKSQSENVAIFQNFDPVFETYEFEDLDPFIGRTTYVATITLPSGEEIISDELKVSTTDETTYFVFPNPVTTGEMKFLTPERDVVLQILNTEGVPITDYVLSEEFTTIPVWFLPSGMYMYRILKEGKTLKTGRVVIRN